MYSSFSFFDTGEVSRSVYMLVISADAAKCVGYMRQLPVSVRPLFRLLSAQNAHGISKEGTSGLGKSFWLVKIDDI